MAESCFNLEDEAFPSFLCTSLDSTSGHPALRNVTLGSGPGLPVAASTVAKIRGGADDRGAAVEASYLDSRELQQTSSQSQSGEHAKFALSFKDDMGSASDFFADHRLSDKLVKIHLDESAPKIQSSVQGLPLAQMGSVSGRLTELGTELSTGLLTFSQFGHKDGTYAKDQLLTAPAEEDNPKSDAVDSNRFSNSDSSFLANEKLMSVCSVNSDLTGKAFSYFASQESWIQEVFYRDADPDLCVLKTTCTPS